MQEKHIYITEYEFYEKKPHNVQIPDIVFINIETRVEDTVLSHKKISVLCDFSEENKTHIKDIMFVDSDLVGTYINELNSEAVDVIHKYILSKGYKFSEKLEKDFQIYLRPSKIKTIFV